MPRKKKIAVVVPKYGLVGGGERFVQELTERLAQNAAYDIHVLANKWQSGSSRITFHKIPVITFPKWLTTISFAWFVQQELKKIKPDIVHTHDRIFRADVVTVHSIPHRTWVKEIRRKRLPSLFDLATGWVERRMFEKGGCEMVLPVSSLAAEKLCVRYPVLLGKIEIMPPGVDLVRFGQSRLDWRNEVRQEFGIGRDDLLVIFVGMNFELKGLELLMRAVALAQSQLMNKKISLLVVGKGEAEKFQKVAHDLGIGANVFFSGIRRDMERVYQAGDIFCLLSQFDTFGMVVSEALAAGLPVIVSEQVGAKDLVVQGENGFVVRWDDHMKVCDLLLQMGEKQTLIRMAKNARQSVANCGWETIARKIIGIYDSFGLLEKKGKVI